jgi:hypothetical protein
VEKVVAGRLENLIGGNIHRKNSERYIKKKNPDLEVLQHFN